MLHAAVLKGECVQRTRTNWSRTSRFTNDSSVSG